MRILHLTMHENTGAGKATLRLHQGSIARNIDSLVLVSQKFSDSSSVVKPKGIISLYKKIQPLLINNLIGKLVTANNIFSVNFTPSLINQKLGNIKPDIINLHWIGWEFIRIEELKKFNVPIIWTLHDMWAFTGGCHYSQECDRYTKSCGFCPQLHSNKDGDLSRWVWQRKAKAWQDMNLTIVTPSEWLAKCAKASSLFQDLPIKVIPNGLDTQKYKPIDKQLAKKLIGLSSDKQIILFGAVSATSDARKGFHLLMPALQKLKCSQKQERIELVVFGSSQPNNPPDFGFKVHYLGRLYDDISLALLYAAADVFVAPSIQDNLPNTVMEALACGTPCVAFNIGGMSDMIEHQQNGYLAQAFVDEDLATGIIWVLEDQERHRKLSDRARKKVEQEFTLEAQASAYLRLYQGLLDSGKR